MTQIETIARRAHEIKKVAALLSIHDNVTVLAAIAHGADTYDALVAKTGMSYHKCASVVHQIKKTGLVEVKKPKKAWKVYRQERNEHTIHAVKDGLGGEVAKMIFES